jgi:hypothetical protein
MRYPCDDDVKLHCPLCQKVWPAASVNNDWELMQVCDLCALDLAVARAGFPEGKKIMEKIESN